MSKISTEERFWSKVNKTESCWLWTRATSKHGYGAFMLDHKKTYVHRLAYEMLVRPIPKGLTIDHLCRVRNCVNPAHMEVVTQGENASRQIHANSKKTNCPSNHPYLGDNLYVSKTGGRNCRECHRIRNRKGRSL